MTPLVTSATPIPFRSESSQMHGHHRFFASQHLSLREIAPWTNLKLLPVCRRAGRSGAEWLT
jgi:hypothetical protein